jgi:outer membrane protein
MKKIFLTLFVAALALTSCGDNASQTTAKTGEGDVTIVADSTVVKMPTGDIAFIKVDEIGYTCKLFQTEGVALNDKINKAMEGFAQKEKNIQNQVASVQNEAAKLQEKYQKGLITTADAQKQQQSIEQKIANYQTNAQKEAETLDEENYVFSNRTQDLIMRAIKEVNADKKYKMVFNASALVDAVEALDISDAVLAKVNELYAAEKNAK